jgi:hypothetical protein
MAIFVGAVSSFLLLLWRRLRAARGLGLGFFGFG